MHVADAQRDVRSIFMGGFAGQLVSGAVWFASAALATWSTPRRAILMLMVGGMLMFPLTQLVLRLMRQPASLAPGHPFGPLAMQIAFTVPLNLPLAGAAALYRLDWFYPACMLIVGAHYLPFVFLYGMWLFAALGALMVTSGIALWVPESFPMGAWFSGALLVVFAFVGRAAVRREDPIAYAEAR